MKKSLVAFTLLVVSNSLLSTTVYAEKSHKLRHRVYKDAKPAAPVVAADAATTPTSNEKTDPTFVQSVMKDVSGTMSLTSNYVFRGMSQTMNLPAIQGGLTYTFPVGLYLSTWGSNVKYTGGGNASVEIDTIAGWAGDVIPDMITGNINYARYNYPGSYGTAYNEINTLWGYKVFQFGFSYSGNVYSTHQSGLYYSGLVTLEIPSKYILDVENVSISGGMGHYSLPRAAGNSYKDYNVSLTKKLNDMYTIMAQWTGTDGRQHYAPYDSNQLLAMVTATF